ncbi:MAG: S8 family serine peptidase [Candidatus Limnocylindrales bacterium]
MKRRIGVALATSALLCLTLLPGGAGAAGPTARFQHLDLQGMGRLPDGAFVPASLSEARVTAMLQFPGDPVALHQAAAHKQGRNLSSAEKASLRSQLKGRQDAARSAVQQAGGTVIGQLQDAYNGVLVQAAQKDLATLAAIPGVVAVHQIRPVSPANVNGVPYIGGPQVWGGTPGNTGAGIKVAILDTGIDYYHADFGGSGNPADFKNADGTTLADNAPGTFPSAKVVGGTDFVGDAYDASSSNPADTIPHPDPDPLDCQGHGSHTAGTLAGFGVTAAGQTFHGPYDATTDANPADFTVGPGVAPGALIYAYRVFGCAGSSDVVAEAIDQAVKDGVDVISMSLGSDLGDQNDPTAVAAENAAATGIVVVAAAGNAGPAAYVNGSPAAANAVISAAAVDGSTPTFPGASLALSTGKTITAMDANGAPLPSGTLGVVVLRNPGGSISLGCDPQQYLDQHVTGKVVVTVRGTCARVARAIFAQQAGAAAAVMVNTDPGLPPFEGPITSDPDTGVPFNVTIPFLGVKGVLGAGSDGDTLVAADGGSVTLTSTTVPNPGYQHQASFSSGGPRDTDSAPKPDVSAPGVSVASVGMGTGTGAAIMSGTSMATPMTAGSAALVLAAHPGWKTDPATLSDRVKAALMNTADPNAAKIIGYDPRLAGSGVVQVQRAVQVTAFATTSDHLESLAFGYLPASGAVHETKSFTITNQNSSAVVYHLSSGDAHVSVPASVTVGAGASATVDATLSLSAADVAALPPAEASNFGALAGTIRGAVLATPASAGLGLFQLRVPFLAVPRGLSNVIVSAASGFQAAPGAAVFSGNAQVGNGGIHAGGADVYAWGIHDPQDTGAAPMDVRDVGVQVLPGSALGGAASDRSLVFAINTWGRAATQSVNEFDVAIDTNGDGQTDVFVVGVDLGLVTAGLVDGEYAAFTIDAASGAVIDAFVADAPMNGSTVELPALASELGITAGKKNKAGTAFSYTVNAFSLVPGGLVDTSATARFDPFHPAASSGQFLSLGPGQSGSLPFTLDRGLQGKTGVLGWLVVTLDDANGASQAAEVPAPTNLGH